MAKIKVCGLTRHEDIIAVNEATPDFCGFIVEYPKSRRSVPEEQLRRLTLVTGMRSQITTDIGAMVELVKQEKDIPCAVGFGISNPEQAKKMAAQSDGVIVGSAIVKLYGTYGERCVPYVRDYVKSMKDAILFTA